MQTELVEHIVEIRSASFAENTRTWSRETLFCHFAADFLVTTLPLGFANGLKVCGGCCLLQKYANVLICFHPVFEN